MKMYVLTLFSSLSSVVVSKPFGECSFLPANQLFPYTPKQQMKVQNVYRKRGLRGSVSELMHGSEFQGSEFENIEYQGFWRKVQACPETCFSGCILVHLTRSHVCENVGIRNIHESGRLRETAFERYFHYICLKPEQTFQCTID
jgi:hypothetical protein